ncbi:MAG: family 16 glycosylhydrolase [Prolixibacteraceae bacterium]
MYTILNKRFLIKVNMLFIGLVLSLATMAQTQTTDWEMVWNDEFNTPGLPDASKWGYEKGLVRNNELQYFTENRTENAQITDSVLIIEARKESYSGAGYTSASLKSQYKGDWKYGRIEVRAKLPTGKGTWPAIWMMPTHEEYGGWPKSGEIDIMENVGKDPNNIYTTVHIQGTNGTGHQGVGKTTTVNDSYNKFYTYAIEWSADSIKWFIDKDLVFSYVHKDGAGTNTWPFDKKFYLILNLAIGGDWGGQQGVDDALFPHQLLIDYVRVYQRETGDGPFSITVPDSERGTVQFTPQQDAYEKNSTVQIKAIPNEGYVFDKFVDMGSENPLTIKVTDNTFIVPVYIKALAEGELLSNGNFDDGLTSWSDPYIFDKTTENAVASVIDGVYTFEIKKVASANWHLGFQQYDLLMTQNKSYRLTFDIWADSPAQAGIQLAKNYGDYGGYLEKSDFEVTSEANTFTYDFTFTKESDNNCRLFFSLGNFKSGKVYLDNISLIVSSQTTAVSSISNSKKQEFKVFPNPVTDQINFNLSLKKDTKTEIELLSIDGRLMSSLYRGMLLQGQHNLNFGINRNEFKSGLYIFRMKSEDSVQSEKILIH